MDLFAKCFEPSLADEAKSRGIYPYFHALESRQDKEVIMEGKRRIMLGSNNYLGSAMRRDCFSSITIWLIWSVFSKTCPARAAFSS